MAEAAGQTDLPDNKLNTDQLDLLLRRLASLPTLPAVAARLVALAGGGDDDAAGGDLIEVMRLDPPLSARLLSQAGRSGRGARTVAQAVQQIGPAAARSAALCVTALPAEEPTTTGEMDWKGFWIHCLAVASAAGMLAGRSGGAIDADEAFVCGLLHDLGKIALQQHFPKTYQRALQAARGHNLPLAEAERKILGVDHCVAGRRLAELWRLPSAVRDVMWLHHQMPEMVPQSLANRDMVGIVGLADTIVRRRRLGFSGNYAFVRAAGELAGQLGLNAASLEKLADELPGAVAAHSRLLGLEEVSSESLYREALAGANAELGRANEHLRSRAEAADTQARAFAHLHNFATALRPDASVPDVLSRAAEVLAAASHQTPSDEKPVIAYSAAADGESILAVRFDGSDKSVWRILPRRADRDRTEAAPAPGPADRAAEILLADPASLAEWADLTDWTHQPLACMGRWIGGVMLPPDRSAPPGRPQPDALEAVAGAVAMAMSIVQGRSDAMMLTEELAGASEVLAATQQVIAESQAISAVGEMASGAAHEMNNPLAVISGRAQLMQEQATGAQERKTWRLIAEQAHRISDIITDMMEYASPPQPAPAAFDSEKLLQQAAEEFAASEHPQAKATAIGIDVRDGTPDILADREQIVPVIRELLANAASAGDGLHVRLTAEADELNFAVILNVRDNGAGMDEQTLAAAFSPFFSAQKAGRHRGMGLPRAKRTVEANGGTIWIHSGKDAGTTVFVRLPAAETAACDETDITTSEPLP